MWERIIAHGSTKNMEEKSLKRASPLTAILVVYFGMGLGKLNR